MTKKEREQLRNAVADYIWSEGCSCCQNRDDHQAAHERLGELLGVKADKEGWHDLTQFRSPRKASDAERIETYTKFSHNE